VDSELAETLVLMTIIGCLPFCVLALPLVHWLAKRRHHHQAPSYADFTEDGIGNVIPTDDDPPGGAARP
jgi:hypothetical protein